MIYYTSDLHFGHTNIIRYENRPYKDVEEMTVGLVNNWNKVVKQNDDVYVLGDFAFKCGKLSVDDINSIVKSLNGKKHLIIGNHDLWINSVDFKSKLWEEVTYYKEIKDNGYDVVLMHYPLESWNKGEYGTIHLHGHLHSNPTKINIKNRYNVGCDNWNLFPVTLKQILNKKG